MRALALILLVAALGASGIAGRQAVRSPAGPAAPDVVTIPAGSYTYRASGNWSRDGRRVEPPLLMRVAPETLLMMRYQVTRAQYARCVAARACHPAEGGSGELPQTGVSWYDAKDYARWLSETTGEAWRLPSDEEWRRAAAERFVDDAAGAAGDPGERLLASYARNTAGRSDASPALRPPGGFGENSRGVADLAGNVWEWTETCIPSGTVDAGGTVDLDSEYCGARIAAGQHRAVVIDFIRDARAGGCGAGVPPDHLGIRLVRDP